MTRPFVAGVAAFAVIAVVLVAAVVVGPRFTGRGDGAVATSASPIASPSPAATPAPAQLPGVVVRVGRPGLDGWEMVVRSESDARPIATLGSFRDAWAAVSPDGRRLALWTNGWNGTAFVRNRVVLWDAAMPDRTTTVFTAPEGEVGTLMVWASDSAGLLLSFDSVLFDPNTPPIGAPPVATVLRTLDIGSREVAEVARVAKMSFVPVAWDRAKRTVAAYEHGPESPYAERYVLIRDGQVSHTALGDRVRTERGERIENVVVNIVASPDASRVVAGVAPAGPHTSATRIVSWPLAEPGRVTELRPAGDRAFAAHGWLPGSARVVVADLPGGYLGRGVVPLFLWDAATGARVTIPDGSTWGTAIPRADGSGLYVTEEDGMTSALDLARGVRSRLPGMDTYSGAAGERRYQGVVVGVLLRP